MIEGDIDLVLGVGEGTYELSAKNGTFAVGGKMSCAGTYDRSVDVTIIIFLSFVRVVRLKMSLHSTVFYWK